MLHYRLDEVDQRILESIRYEARKTFTEIGSELGITRVTVRRRMSSMEKAGVIRSYHTVIREDEKEDSYRFFLDISVKPGRMEEVLTYLKANPIFQRIYQISGKSRIRTYGIAVNQATMDANVQYICRRVGEIENLEWFPVLTVEKEE